MLWQNGEIKDKGATVGVPTILDIRTFLLAPMIELLALDLRIARQTFNIEGNAFLGGDNLLHRSSGARIARTMVMIRPEPQP